MNSNESVRSRHEKLVRTVELANEVSGYPEITDKAALKVKKPITPSLVRLTLTAHGGDTNWHASVRVYGSMPYSLMNGWADFAGRSTARESWPAWLRDLVARYEPSLTEEV